MVTSDFTGDGTMDFILYPTTKNKYWVFWDPDTNSPYTQMGYEINSGYFEEILPVTWLTHNNKLLSGQGFVVIKYVNNSTIKFEVKSAGTVSPVYPQYEKQWDNVDNWTYYSECTGTYEQQDDRVGRKFFSGDFNGMV